MTPAPPSPPQQLQVIPPPATVAEAIAALHTTSGRMDTATDALLRLAQLAQQPPEMRTVVINPGNNGVYQVVDESAWPAKSIAILNPDPVPVYIGVGGVSARPTSRAPTCPPSGCVVLPVEAQDVELGCNPTDLGTSSAVIYIFRYVTVQPLSLTAA